ncbi:MAG: hypothetical protein AB7W28_05190 [Armatimonadota bacterium]
MEMPEVRRLRGLEAEKARLRRIVAQQAMDLDALKKLLRGEEQALGASEEQSRQGEVKSGRCVGSGRATPSLSPHSTRQAVTLSL